MHLSFDEKNQERGLILCNAYPRFGWVALRLGVEAPLAQLQETCHACSNTCCGLPKCIPRFFLQKFTQALKIYIENLCRFCILECPLNRSLF